MINAPTSPREMDEARPVTEVTVSVRKRVVEETLRSVREFRVLERLGRVGLDDPDAGE